MTKADSVLSTPRTTASKINPPVDLMRRHLLTIGAGGAVAAAIPTGAVAGIPTSVDPIYAAIERHKQTCIVWEAAVDIRSNFNDLDMTDEQRERRDELDDAVEDAWEPCEQAGIDLINTEPTTRAGIVAAITYIRIQMRDDGTYMPHGVKFEYTEGCAGDSPETMGWIEAFLDAIASAAAELGKGVQS
jgi:hypothetical protein